MDYILEIILEILVDGALAGAVDKKVPLPLRILLGLILLGLFGGTIGLLCWVGIDTGKWQLTGLGLFLLACCIFWVRTVWKSRRK